MKLSRISVVAGLILGSITVINPAHALPDATRHAPGKPAAAHDAASLRQAGFISGKVVETMNSAGYSYVLVDTGDGEKRWVAVQETKITVGKEVAFPMGTEMANFNSKTLNRTFDKIVFTSGPIVLPGTKGSQPATKKKSVEGMGKAACPTDKTTVEKAQGENAYTVCELFRDRTKLDKKDVVVHARVVKVSLGIMNKTWIHLQDGSGDPGKGNDDLVVTTATVPAVGNIVTVSGKLSSDKDFGYGYSYEAMIEDATVKVEKPAEAK